eukprot:TRINITY_DN6375_c0_g2_i1.p1 TRINITY_DN6375_c0_g2~~TRINITY_DN6375_c0_g2_i1.p1  ORF type:complete len:424 (-),score=79.17 TRINITY_DN6375_c0_g2_i1:831-2102(-)
MAGICRNVPEIGRKLFSRLKTSRPPVVPPFSTISERGSATSWRNRIGSEGLEGVQSPQISKDQMVSFSSSSPRIRSARGHMLGAGHWHRMSTLPEATVYSGPTPQIAGKRITLRQIAMKYAAKEPLSMVTAYDYPSAVHVDTAGIDILLVGDSVAMVVHGHDTTLPVTMDQLITHCQAVSRGAQRPLLVGDLPFGSYEQSPAQAVSSAVRMLKEGRMDAVKIEGGGPARVAACKAAVDAGIAVMGHTGLTPQAISSLGGFRPQGRDTASAVKVVEHALALEEAGCFAIVLECIPAPVAAAVTAAVGIPTIGIGAGPCCSGQVLVYHDLLGMMQHPHYVKVTPKFCKQFVSVGDVINEGLRAFHTEVRSGQFPSKQHTPYRIEESEVHAFVAQLRERGMAKVADAAEEASEKQQEAKGAKGTEK